VHGQTGGGGGTVTGPPPLRIRDVMRTHTLPAMMQTDSLRDALVVRRGEIAQILAEELAANG